MQQIRRRLLHELKLELADLTPFVSERGHALMGMVLRVPHQHQRQRRARPGSRLAGIAPDAAELRDDRPVARALAGPLRHELTALQRHQDISGRDEAQRDAWEEPRIATVDLRVVEPRPGRDRCLRDVQQPREFRRGARARRRTEVFVGGGKLSLTSHRHRGCLTRLRQPTPDRALRAEAARSPAPTADRWPYRLPVPQHMQRGRYECRRSRRPREAGRY